MRTQILFSPLAFMMTSILCCQDFKPPANYRLVKKEDYKKYEKEVIACINYLENTPLDDKTDLTKQTKLFFIEWATGSPDVNIKVKGYITELTKKNRGLLLIFFAGWTKFALENPEDVNDFKRNLAGLESIIKVYNIGKGIKKDEKLKKLIKRQEEGKLEKWLKEQLEKKSPRRIPK